MSDNEQNEKQERKPYEKPKLTAYGDVREITLGGGSRAMPDSGGGPAMNMVKS